MGVESSHHITEANSNNFFNNPLSIPSSLRPVYPFLYDAYRYVKQSRNDPKSTVAKKKIALSCINHGIKLLFLLNIDFDIEGKDCLKKFNDLRNQLGKELNIPLEPLPDKLLSPKVSSNEDLAVSGNSSQNISSHEILLAEADAILALAEELAAENIKFDAMLNYHTAAVFYRVLMSMIPALSTVVHQRLNYSAFKTRQMSAIAQNFVLEHFGSKSCADVYEVHGTAKLGKGSYGSVYLATHRITGDERAVKVMNVDRVTSYYLRKLHTEIAVLRAIDHPNIVKLQDVFFGRRSVYLVTDLCRGGELFELLNSGKSQGFVFREDRASQLMRDMISAVSYLHERGIVHRDLKLENFLFESKTASSPLVLIDFGLSRFYETNDFMNQRVGSCYYTAPEVLNGLYDQRCDNWSLGVLCYMLLSGTPPFYGKTVDEVYQATLTQDPVFTEKKFRHVSNCCVDFMHRLLTKDPDTRMTAKEALLHPFITGVLPPLGGLTAAFPLNTSKISDQFTIQVGSQISMASTSGLSNGPSSTLTSVPTSGSGTIPSPPTSHSFGFGWNPFQSHPQTSPQQYHAVDITAPDNILLENETRRQILPPDLASSVVDSLIVYASADPLLRLLLILVSHTLNPEATVDIRRVFQAIDTSHSGVVTAKDISMAVMSCQSASSIDFEVIVATSRLEYFTDSVQLQTPPTSSKFSIRNDVSQSTRGKVSSGLLGHERKISLSYHDFLAAILFSRMDIHDERIRYVFSILDTDNSGFISADSLKKFFGAEITDHAVAATIQCADWDGDGQISENDFMQKWRHFRRSHGRTHSNVVPAMAQAALTSVLGSQPPLHIPLQSSPQTAAITHRRSASGGKPFTLRSSAQMNQAFGSPGNTSTYPAPGEPTSISVAPPHHRRQRSHQVASLGIAGLHDEPMDLT